MFYIKQDEENRKALQYIKDVLNAHVKMLQDKEEELLSLATDTMKNNINNMLSSKEPNKDNEQELELFSSEIEFLDIKIAAIRYTYDYVKLMMQQCKTLDKDI